MYINEKKKIYICIYPMLFYLRSIDIEGKEDRRIGRFFKL